MDLNLQTIKFTKLRTKISNFTNEMEGFWICSNVPDVLRLVRPHEVREVIEDVVAVVGAEDGAEPTDGRQRQQGSEGKERKGKRRR